MKAITRIIRKGVSTHCVSGNYAAAYTAYGLSDQSFLFPITPASPMGEEFDSLTTQEKLNVFGEIPGVTLMQSENGVVGGIHGSLTGGSLTTTFTSSQGLMLMLPSMMRISEELLPSVFHVASRAVAGKGHSIFGDHHDVMSIIPAGFCLLSSSCVQECHDLALVAHLSSLSASLPFIHQFDGFRTSHELNTIDLLDYDEISQLLDFDDVNKFRERRMNTTNPSIRGLVYCEDTYFQMKESANSVYSSVPNIVQEKMDLVSSLTNRPHSIFEYHGADDAENVVVVMGSGGMTVTSILDEFPDCGVVIVKLFLPWSTEHFIEALPTNTVKKITVLDRVKEHGKREPMYLNVVSSLYQSGLDHVQVIGGRFGLGSKEFSPDHVIGVFENMRGPMKDDFTIGIDDDVTHLSIPMNERQEQEDDEQENDTYQCMFYGIGGDGTIGSNQEAIQIVQSNTDLASQGYFVFDLKKSGGLTVSHLRFGKERFEKPYLIQNADFVGCHVQSYVKKYNIVGSMKKNSTLVLNSEWTSLESLEENLPASMKKQIAEKGIKFYNIDANQIVGEIGGMGRKTNMIMQTSFFLLNDKLIDLETSISELEDSLQKYKKKGGEEVVKKNLECIHRTKDNLKLIEYPVEEWKNLEVDDNAADDEYGTATTTTIVTREEGEQDDLVGDIKCKIIKDSLALKGDDLPVSQFMAVDFPSGGSEKDLRNIAIHVPTWEAEKCIECVKCSLICPQSTIRPFLVTESEIVEYNENINESEVEEGKLQTKPFMSIKTKNKNKNPEYEFTIQVNPHYCVECTNCVNVCPTEAIHMEHVTEEEMTVLGERFDYVNTIPGVSGRIEELKEASSTKKNNPVLSTQLGFSYCNYGYGCQGCGEVGYMRVLSQVLGNRMLVAAASGCVPVWMGSQSNAFHVDEEGYGPSFNPTLFENNAEFGIGLTMAAENSRKRLQVKVVDYLLKDREQRKQNNNDSSKSVSCNICPELRMKLVLWLKDFDDFENSMKHEKNIRKILEGEKQKLLSLTQQEQKDVDSSKKLMFVNDLLRDIDLFKRTSVWAIGGDGWSSDINFGGLIHSLSLGENMKVLVVDSETYSNTGGQASKGTQLGAVAKFLSNGKETGKMDLAEIVMSLGNVYVASCCLSHPQQYIRAIREAESFNGPSLIICYSPCISHGADLTNTMKQYEMAVKSGYWNIFRYDPRLEKEGRNPFQLDFDRVNQQQLDSFLDSNSRFESLERINKERYDVFRDELKHSLEKRFLKLKKRSDRGFDRDMPVKEVPVVKTHVEHKVSKSISRLKKEIQQGTRRFEESTSIHPSMFDPKSIVLVGASDALTKPGGKLLQNLKKSFDGDLYVMKKDKENVQDIKTTFLEDLPSSDNPIDVAILSIPVSGIIETTKQLLEKGVRSFIIVSAGFKELGGKGAELEKELVELMNSHDACLMGPNCIGLLNETYNGMFVDIKGSYSSDGNIDVVSASGATACFLIEKGSYHGLTFRNVMSVGNAAQLGVEDFVRYLDETYDPENSAQIKLVYLEEIKKPKIFFKHCKSLTEKGCRIIAVKAGVSEAGKRAASSHTGAVATPDHIVDAGFLKAGVVRVSSRDEMVKVAGILVEDKKMTGRNLAVITHAGGSAILLTDALGKNGVDIPFLGNSLKHLLKELPNGSTVNNPIDFLATGTLENAESVIDSVVKELHDEINGIAFIFGSPGLEDITPMYEMINEKKKEIDIPIYSVFPSILTSHESIETFKKKGNFFFDDEVSFGRSLARMINYEYPRELYDEEGNLKKPTSSDEIQTNLPSSSSIDEIQKIMGSNKKTGYLHPVDVKRVLNLVGISTVEEMFCTSVEDVRSAATKIGYPFAMKVVGPIHKTNVDGVVTDISSEEIAISTFHKMSNMIDGFQGVILQPMVKGWEFFCGAKYDDYLDGHMLAFGSGGVQLEIIEDIRIVLSPTNPEEIERNLRKLKTFELFQGFRNKIVDMEKFIDVVMKVDQLCSLAPEILEMDINPIISSFEEGGFISVDCRIKVEGSEEEELYSVDGTTASVMLAKQASESKQFMDGTFPQIERAPLDPILGLNIMYNADKHPMKVNLGIGAYRTEELESYTLGCVTKAEEYILEMDMHHDYPPEDGVLGFNQFARTMCFGEDCQKVLDKKITTVQTISGSGALSVGGDFIRTFLRQRVGGDYFTNIFATDPTWANHYPLFQNCGFDIEPFTYLNHETMKLDFDGMMEGLNEMNPGSVVLLHASCHNPTGVDPTEEQWDDILQCIQEQNLIPFFDAAYLGFGSGDHEKDAYAIRKFVNDYDGHNGLVAQSFSKNFGLYGERVGALHIICNSETNAENIRTQLKKLIRKRYSVPPIHGARIVEKILGDEELTKDWVEEVKIMRNRLRDMRVGLYDHIIKIGTPGDWSHLEEQTGMFSFTGLNPEQCRRLVDEFHIYLVENGRISLTGLNHKNIPYVAESIKKVILEEDTSGEKDISYL